MPARPVLDIRLDDRVELRKPHPCGSRTWGVTRLGADIGIVCEGCGRRVLVERRDLERQLRRFVERAEAETGDVARDADDDAPE